MMKQLQLLIGTKIKARGLKRPAICAKANAIAERAFPSDPLDLSEEFIRDLMARLTGPPRDGRALRCVLAACDIPIVDALRALEYWPDLRPRPAQSRAQAVIDALHQHGYNQATLIAVGGTRITIDIGPP